MKKTRALRATLAIVALVLGLSLTLMGANSPASATAGMSNPRIIVAGGPSLPVTGADTLGKLPKWQTNSIIGDSSVFEDKTGNVGIGTTAPASRLTVDGVIESGNCRFKFPDGTVQTTSSAGSPVAVTHDQTLSGKRGDGTAASPLGMASPLSEHDGDNSARQPVQFLLSSIDKATFDVPAAKRLVIEYVSGIYNLKNDPSLPNVSSDLNISTTAGGALGFHVFLAYKGGAGPETTSYSIAQSVKIYADTGTQVVARTIGSFFLLECSGHYVDAPQQEVSEGGDSGAARSPRVANRCRPLLARRDEGHIEKQEPTVSRHN